MSISVSNKAGSTISASINQWGDDGDTNVFNIDDSKTENWDRTDPRGFIMTVKFQGSDRPYFVTAGYAITVTADQKNPQIPVLTNTAGRAPVVLNPLN